MSHPGHLHHDALAAIQAAGVTITEPDRLRTDGVLCRFATQDKDRHRGKRNGWAVVFADGARPVVTFGDWATGLTETAVLGTTGPLSAPERERQRIAIEQAKAAREAELRHRQTKAAIEARCQWREAAPASPDHPYLARKRIDAEGLRERYSFLLVPMHDERGQLHNLQRIRADGQKRFLRGGRVTGLYGRIGDIGGAHLLVCETGKNLHGETGLPVAVAFSAGNLLPVAETLRRQAPKARLTLCADNDAKPDGSNPGVEAATRAAEAVGGHLAIPPIAGDFNDYAVARGKHAWSETFHERDS